MKLWRRMGEWLKRQLLEPQRKAAPIAVQESRYARRSLILLVGLLIVLVLNNLYTAQGWVIQTNVWLILVWCYALWKSWKTVRRTGGDDLYQRLRRHEYLLCPDCEYSLKGHKDGDPCPECGKSYRWKTVRALWQERGYGKPDTKTSETCPEKRQGPPMQEIPQSLESDCKPPGDFSSND